MNPNNHNSTVEDSDQSPSEAHIEDLLTKVRPLPRAEFHQRMENKPWNRQGRWSWNWLRLYWMPASLVLALLFVFFASLASPTLEALAQRVAQFFTPASHDQVLIEVPAAELIYPETRFSLSVAEASALAGFELKQPQYLPPGYAFQGADFNQARGAITFNYQTEDGLVLRISQRSAGIEYQKISLQAIVEHVRVGATTGEYVEGGWITSQPADQDPGSAVTVTLQAVWDPDANIHFLRWQENDILYELFFSGTDPNLPGYLTKADILAVAESME